MYLHESGMPWPLTFPADLEKLLGKLDDVSMPASNMQRAEMVGAWLALHDVTVPRLNELETLCTDLDSLNGYLVSSSNSDRWMLVKQWL